jgi:cytosine/adenosine deaminase-related metal-dependent hydrolase
MPRLFTARCLLPISAPPIEGGALYVRDRRIAAVGRLAEVRRLAPSVPVTDFGDAVLLPPLVNAHTHLELTDFPRWADQLGETETPSSFVEWILQTVRVKRSIPREAFSLSLTAGIRRSLTAGTGAVGDILSDFPARSGYGRAPLYVRSFLEVLGRDTGRWQELLDEAQAVLENEGEGRVRFGLSPHSPYTLAEEGLRACLETARRRQVPLSMHLAEAPAETEFLQTASGPLVDDFFPMAGWQDRVPAPAGLSPVGYLESRGGLRTGMLLVHGVQVTPEDVRRIAGHSLSVVLCPRSNARLGVGRAPLGDYLEAGVNLALGTDSLASCKTLSVWDEIAFACQWFGSALAPEKALEMATAGGARALGLQGEMGALREGMGGHFQVLVPEEPFPDGDLCGYLTGGCGKDVRHLFLAGEDALQKRS